ncbi:KdsC family phosphatase [Acinetobacter pollinis]|jgi:3-deoxy-D-manno-octulosonate 8-phosphate phosphatase (KDO 8-P phosphatase)|uniref:KdsC family phosphatase n=1 Tax=Acinetobacter pollinis TaxID=2605270 RepID=UPI0018A310C7|nr:HAD-IIIA family hydrolase [Acinetobacter pollinis]MBF7690319.1 HAD-IIIA family hydrolase [Acinetobacter pollinis]MBF7692854.1 HAD-IIIA family hydrolase [Acinetobacter pollinis]MBF7697825.1 HAD-IIIA family hydrolase [Acinetobacter pollinis]MBF7700567.1 HAD-IIIA family hydrolase [Acinetobacter pollinis]
MTSQVQFEKAKNIQALVLDVDGILSDGFVTLTNSGDEIKSFDIRDGLGMKLVQQAGLKVIIITGRQSQIVTKRMTDLGVDLIYQGREDKGTALQEACKRLSLNPEDCLYMGDDWPDLSAFSIAGMKVTVPNGHIEVRKRADFVTQAMGGRGAVREVCDILLEANGHYEQLLKKYLATSH